MRIGGAVRLGLVVIIGAFVVVVILILAQPQFPFLGHPVAGPSATR